MDRAEAIKRFEKQLTSAQVVLDSGFGTRPGESNRLYVERKEMAEIALIALREQEQREQGCEYCRGKEALYQHTNTTKLYINTFGQARTLVTECDHCPPHAYCSVSHVPARSAFLIKHCPECGRKLTKEGADRE